MLAIRHKKGVPLGCMGVNETQPYKTFGTKLRNLREKARESLLEVSGAVEIDEATLARIEDGQQLPDEEILVLLMNHFGVEDQDAVSLWELAGYSNIDDKNDMNEEQLIKQIMMVIPFDNRVAFSDTADISANKNGVVVNFSLAAGNPQPQSIARIGMSLDQAQNLIDQLKNSITQATQPKVIKALPAPKNKTEKKNKA